MRAILTLKENAEKEILDKISSKAKIVFVSSLVNAVGIETDSIEEIKRFGFVKEARISEKTEVLFPSANSC